MAKVHIVTVKTLTLRQQAEILRPVPMPSPAEMQAYTAEELRQRYPAYFEMKARVA